jgi:hypothetical protein
MIKPQQVPELFEELRKLTNDRPLAQAHIDASTRSKAGALKSRIMALPYANASELQKMSDSQIMEYAVGNATSDFYSFKAQLASSKNILYYCDKDMSDIVEMGATVLTDEDLADTTQVPTESGFCYFAKGITLSDTMIIHALSWNLRRPATDTTPAEYLVVAYNDRFSDADLAVEGWSNYFTERGLAIPNSRWIYRGETPYRHGDVMAPTEALTKALGDMGAAVVRITPSYVFHSLILMLQQPPEIVTVSRRELTNKKQLKRLKAKSVPSEVTVVDIRHKYRSVSSSASTTDREYSRRWLVTGHWRWQPMKDRETGLAIRKRIWVNPYIKGPADKPFVATKRVHALLK